MEDWKGSFDNSPQDLKIKKLHKYEESQSRKEIFEELDLKSFEIANELLSDVDESFKLQKLENTNLPQQKITILPILKIICIVLGILAIILILRKIHVI